MSQRLKVLISAYACEPNKGSEPEVGWQWALQMARFHDVTVLTRENNRSNIESALKDLAGTQPPPKFVFHDRSAFFLDMKRRSKAVHLYYLLWQKSARELVAQLHAMHRFDLMHHVTFAGFRYPTAIWGHGVASIWGPIGGIESIPRSLLPWKHPASLIYEVFRNLNNLAQATPIYVLPRRARATTMVLASTLEMKQAFDKLGVASKLVPSIGLKTSNLEFQPKQPRSGPLRLIFVGNIITLKGLDLALEALKSSKTDAVFTLVGSGRFESAAKRYVAANGLASRVFFTGRKPRNECLSLYREHDVFLFPSLHDTGGYAVIEAMFNELPVICLDCGGPSVAVDVGCGIRVPAGTRSQVIERLANAIEWYDKNPAAQISDGKSARQKILKDYDWDNKGVQMNDLYLETYNRFQKEASGGAKQGYTGMGSITNIVNRMFSLRGIFATLAGFFLIGAIGFLSIGHLKTQARRIVNDTLPGLTYAGEANASLAQAFNRTLVLLMTDDRREQQQIRNEISSFSQATTASLNSYRSQMFEPQDDRLFENLVRRRNDYLHVRANVLELVERGDRGTAMRVYRNELAPAYRAYKSAGDKLFEYNIEQGKFRGKNILTVATTTQFVVAAIGIIIFLIGFLVGLFK
jgi:glycosyltransferase involved in cell wall biosynthesis